MDKKFKLDYFIGGEYYPAFLSKVVIQHTKTERFDDDGEFDEIIRWLSDYDVTFIFVVYNGVSYKTFYKKFEKICTIGKASFCYFCYEIVAPPYWETDNIGEWKEFCKYFDLRELLGCYMEVKVNDYSIPTIESIIASYYYEPDEEDDESEFDYENIFKDYECPAYDDYRYDSVNEIIRDVLMHYFD